MKLIGTELGRIVLLFSPEEGRPLRGLHPPDVFKAITERYSFEYSPDLHLPWDEVQKNGIRFKLGKFSLEGKTVAISELTFYNDGIVISAFTTEDAEAISKDLLSWAKETLGFRDFIKLPRQLYLSHIVVKFAHSPNKLLKSFEQFSTILSELYEKRYKNKVPFELVSLNIGYDKLNVPQWFAPATFSIERRVGKQFEDDTFFCEAGLSTTDHIQALEALEKSFPQ
jgi:hypothetical protein